MKANNCPSTVILIKNINCNWHCFVHNSLTKHYDDRPLLVLIFVCLFFECTILNSINYLVFFSYWWFPKPFSLWTTPPSFLSCWWLFNNTYCLTCWYFFPNDAFGFSPSSDKYSLIKWLYLFIVLIQVSLIVKLVENPSF